MDGLVGHYESYPNLASLASIYSVHMLDMGSVRRSASAVSVPVRM